MTKQKWSETDVGRTVIRTILAIYIVICALFLFGYLMEHPIILSDFGMIVLLIFVVCLFLSPIFWRSFNLLKTKFPAFVNRKLLHDWSSGIGKEPNSAKTAVLGWASLITAFTAAAIIVRAAIPSRSGWAFEILVPGVTIAIVAVFLAIVWVRKKTTTSPSTTFFLGWGALLTGFMAAVSFLAYTVYKSPLAASAIRGVRRRIVRRRLIRRGTVGLEFADGYWELLVIAVILTVAALILGLIWAKAVKKQTGSSRLQKRE